MQDEQHIPEQTEQSEEQPQAGSTETKKPFVEPQISAAINVFDATTFFLQGSNVGEDLPP
jgi:hypothetical protein